MITTTPPRPLPAPIEWRIVATTDRIARVWRHTRARIHLPHRSTVTAIECGHCRRWVHPSRYSLRYRACPPCAQQLAHTARARLRATRAAAHQ